MILRVKFRFFLILLLSLSSTVSRADRRILKGGSNPESDFEYDNRFNSRSSAHNRQNSRGDTSRCPREFWGRCTCEYRADNKYAPEPRLKYFVDCSSSGFTNTSMLEYLPAETEVLVFTGNQLPILRSYAFGKQSRTPNLRVIDFSNNGIREIDGRAFHNVEMVEVLWLAHNDLSNSSLHNHPQMFSNFYSLRDLYLTNAFNEEIWSFSDLSQIFAESNLTKLEKLHLGLNELTIITNPTAFCSLPSLKQLYIPQNKLTDDVELNVTCMPNLEIIDLRQNKIRSITPKSNLWKLLNVTNSKNESIRVELLVNPFHCDCNLQSFIDWLKSEIRRDPDKVRDEEDLKCETGYPPSNKNKALRDIDSTECETLSASVTASHVVTGIVWILSILCVLTLLTCGYVYRLNIFQKVSPLLHTVSTGGGVQYTSINKNDTVEIAHV